MSQALVEADDFRIRCSGVGSIMADPKKGEKLPRGAITFIQNWYYEQMTGTQLFNGNKATKKGWEVEDEAINDYAKVTNYSGLVKNVDFFGNDFTEGTPDVLVGDDLVVDIKSPWSIDTYSKYASHKPTVKYPAPNANYFWQLQAYMLVTNRQRAELAYVLRNTPKHLLENMNDRREWRDYESEFSLKERVKIFVIPRSNAHICRIEQRVELCRDYLRRVTIPENS
jgi:hypothetical protein